MWANATTAYSSHGAGQAGGKITHALALIDTCKSYHADLTTIQLGENDGALTVDQYQADYAQLLDDLLNNTPRPRIFCWGVWNSSSIYRPTGRETLLDAVMQEECDKRGIPFRSVRDVAMDPANHTPNGNAVGWHPNDNGQLGYANLFWAAMGPELTGQ